MYAIFQDGGHQYKVESGDVCRVQLKNAEEGSSITFGEVAAIGGDESRVGTPFVEGAAVKATVVRHVKGEKIIVGRFRRRQNSRTKNGHRQRYTEIHIDSIDG